jgi:hypothetical protein
MALVRGVKVWRARRPARFIADLVSGFRTFEMWDEAPRPADLVVYVEEDEAGELTGASVVVEVVLVDICDAATGVGFRVRRKQV